MNSQGTYGVQGIEEKRKLPLGFAQTPPGGCIWLPPNKGSGIGAENFDLIKGPQITPLIKGPLAAPIFLT